MKYFDHHNAASLEEALKLLKGLDGRGKLIAGGTDLLGTLKADILPDYPEALVNIKTVATLDFIREEADYLSIGATTKLTEIEGSPAIRREFPMLAEAVHTVASPEIRNMATLGGNLCQDTRCWYYRYPHAMGGRILCYRKGGRSCPAVKGDNRYHAIFQGKKCFAAFPSDAAVALAALDALAVSAGPEGGKTTPVQDFYETKGCILRPNEILTEIRVPRPATPRRQSFVKFRLRQSVDFAIVSVACSLAFDGDTCSDARIVLGAVAPTPYRAVAAEKTLAGSPLSPPALKRAADAAVAGAKALSGNAYKVSVARALVKRDLEEAGAPSSR